MKIKIGKTLKQICINSAKNLIPIIFLSIILCGEGYAKWEKTNFPDTVKVNTIVIKDSSVFVGTERDGIFISANNGENWKSINKGLQSKIIHTILISGEKIFAGTETGVSVSMDGGENWRSINSGLSGLGVWSFAINSDPGGDTTIYAGTWSGVYFSTDWGEKWEATSLSSTTMPVKSIIIYKNFILAATFSNGIFESQDNGLTWKNIDVKTEASMDYDFIPKFAPIYSISLFADSENNYIMVGSIGGLYYAGLGDTLFYADTSFAKVYKKDAPVLCFANRNDTLFTSIDGYLYKLYWIHIIWHNLPLITYTAERLYNVHFILGIPVVYSLALNNSFIFAGTEEGIWRLRYPGTITRVENSQDVPAGFVLEQNYPNPFNPTTTIKYSIPVAETGHAPSLLVTLKVYDILGNVVQTLVNKEQQPGSYSVRFAAGSRHLASGVYFYKLQAGSFVQTKKMILLQ